MDDETLNALQGSIAKWEAIVAGTGEDNGVDNCPLCLVFCNQNNEEVEDLGCWGCPVAEEVGNTGCCDTPYYLWSDLTADQEFPRTAKTPSHKEAAQNELDFLRSLLPAPALTSPVETP